MNFPTYRYTASWEDDGWSCTRCCGGFRTKNEAYAAAEAHAADSGYKDPRWWEFWRKRLEIRIDLDYEWAALTPLMP
jgi:hypothetical protein